MPDNQENEGVVATPGLELGFRRCDLVAKPLLISAACRSGTESRTLSFAPDRLDAASVQGGVSVTGESGALRVGIFLRAPARGQHCLLGCRLTNLSPGPLHAISFVVEFDFSLRSGEMVPNDRISWFRNGWQSWSFAGAVRGDSPSIPLPRLKFVYGIKEDDSVDRGDAPFTSDMVGGVKIGDNAVVIGAGDQRFFQRIRVTPGDSSFRVSLEIDLDGEPIPPGETLSGGEWHFEGERTMTVLLRRWGERSVNRPPGRKPLAGWCSWYDRHRNITAAYILEVAARMARDPAFAALDTVLIDDGYQDHVGDWLAYSNRFGADIRRVGRAIKALGRHPGIWLAPFVAQSRARVLQEHPDWFQHDCGRPRRVGWNPHWKGAFYALDPRNPAVLAWLRQTFMELREAGFEVFKLDYLFAAAARSPRPYNSPGRFEAFANAIRVIRTAVGEEAVLLGCGAPLAPSRGLFDHMRVSTDVSYSFEAPGWLQKVTGDRELTGIKPMVRNTLARATFAHSFWGVDPDCVLLRKRRFASAASPNEAALAAALAAHNGEVFFLGDDITLWGDDERGLLEKLLPWVSTDFVPLNSADSSEATFACFTNSNRTYLAAYNLGEEKEMISFPIPLLEERAVARGLRAVTQNAGRIEEDRVSLSRVASHTCALVELLDKNEEEE